MLRPPDRQLVPKEQPRCVRPFRTPATVPVVVGQGSRSSPQTIEVTACTQCAVRRHSIRASVDRRLLLLSDAGGVFRERPPPQYRHEKTVIGNIPAGTENR